MTTAVACAAVMLAACAPGPEPHRTRAAPQQLAGIDVRADPPLPTPVPASDPAPTLAAAVTTTTAAARAVRARASRSAVRPAVTTVPAPPPGVDGAGTARASWYGRGARTADGEAFRPDTPTFAHRTMPFGTLIRFCAGGRCVVARCTDRGPAVWTGRTFDLSRGAFAAIAPLSAGVITVTWGPA